MGRLGRVAGCAAIGLALACSRPNTDATTSDAGVADARAADAVGHRAPLGRRLFAGRGAHEFRPIPPREVGFFVIVPGADSADLYVAPLESITDRPLFRGVSLHHAYTVNAADAWLVHEARTILVGSVGRRVGTLARVARDGALLEAFPNVATSFYTPSPRPVMFERVSGDASGIELVLRDEERERVFPRARFIRRVGDAIDLHGADGRFVRVDDGGGPQRTLSTGVARVVIGGGGYYVLQLTDGAGGGLSLLDAQTQQSRRLPGDDACCVLESTVSWVVYGEQKTEAHPARVHRFNLNSGDDQVWDVPGLVAVKRAEPVPSSEAYVLLDGEGGAAWWHPTGGALRAIASRVFNPLISYDGAHVVWFDDSRDGASLLLSDSAFTREPVVISPPDSIVQRATIGISGRSNVDPASHVLFKAFTSPERDVSTLHAWDLASSKRETVELGCLDVNANGTLVAAVVGARPGAGRGDLVFRDRDAGTRVTIAREVVQFRWLPEGGPIVYVVEAPTPGAHDGVWSVDVEGLK